MILPGKHLSPQRSLMGIGGAILSQLTAQRTVSELWDRVRDGRSPIDPPLSFDWFVMALTFLFSIGAIEYDRGLISVTNR